MLVTNTPIARSAIVATALASGSEISANERIELTAQSGAPSGRGSGARQRKKNQTTKTDGQNQLGGPV